MGPFAEILATTDEKPGIVYCEMDFEQVGSKGPVLIPQSESLTGMPC